MPTHFTDNTESLIDVVCSNLPVRRITYDSVGRSNGHQLIVSDFKIKKEKFSPRFLTFRPLNDIVFDLFNNDLISIPWQSIGSLNDVNDLVEFFNLSLLYLFDLHAPLKTIVLKDHGYPWITYTVKEIMKLRDDALSSFRSTKLNSKKIYYKALKAEVLRALHFDKAAYFNQYINNKIKNPKVLWKNLKKTILPPKSSELPLQFNDPNLINRHFLNVPGVLNTNISMLTFFEYNRFGEAEFNIKTVTCNEIMKIISSLKSNAEGNDMINIKMLLMTLPVTLEVITSIVNTSITTSTFPDSWKTASVLPFPKIPEPVVMKDLRPISILPCTSKILEKVVSKQLVDFLEKHKLLPEVQSGFRKGRSTTTALLDITDNVIRARDEGLITLLVLLDFSRAFDCLNITLLLSKLSYYGLSSSTVRWFSSYLSGRSQYVKLSKSDGMFNVSEKLPVERGVPQGSILGPLLFIIFSSDICQHIEHCKYHIYADDVQLYISFKAEDASAAICKLNADLAKVSHWADKNSLVLNPLKTKYMAFGTKHKLSIFSPPHDIVLLGEPVERVYDARNLGLLFDPSLRFERHIAESVRSCFYKLKVLYNIRTYLSEELRVQLVESLILSKLNYVDTVTGPQLLGRTQRLVQRAQNACARFCFNIPPRAHVTPFLNRNSLLKMKARQKLHLACLLFGVIKYHTPEYLYNKLSWMSKTRSLRKCSKQLSTQHHRSAAFRGSFQYAATKCWNNIPPPIRELRCFHLFKTKLKQCLLEHQKKTEDLRIDISFL